MQNIYGEIIVIKKRKAIHFVSINEIIACEASHNTTKFHLLNNEIIIAPRCLKYYEIFLLKSGFIKISRSVIIAVCQIRSVKSKTVLLINGITFKLHVSQNIVIDSVTTKFKA